MMMLQMQRQQYLMPLGGMLMPGQTIYDDELHEQQCKCLGGCAGGGMAMRPMTMIQQQPPQQQPAMQSVNASAAGGGQPSKNEEADSFASLSG